jgi:superkiller protein 3
VKARYNLGVVYASIGRYDQAQAEYRQVITLEPSHAMARANLAWILQQQQRHGEAISELERLRELTPDDTNVLYQLGLLHKQIGDPAKARWYWEAVVSVDPRHVGALLALADAARTDGDAARTLGYALDALAVDPQHPAAQIMAARAHMQLLEYRQAADILEALAQRLPHSGEVRFHLGALAHERGDLEEARVHLAEACRLDDHHADYHNEYATVLYRLGAFEDAVDHFREAESLAPDNPVVKANLGFCYMALGEHAAAAQYFEAFMARPGGGESVELAVQCAMDLL